MKKCPCHSEKPYGSCCQPFHQGKVAESAEELMRSRYAAYAMNNASYIIETTHLNNPYYHQDLEKWRKEIDDFSKHTDFLDLKILEVKPGEKESFVTFHASLKNYGRDVSFTEKSRFLKVDERWLYRGGELFPATNEVAH